MQKNRKTLPEQADLQEEAEDKGLKQIKNVADKTEKMGDKCFEMWNEKRSLPVAKTGILAYRTTLYANGLLIKLKEIGK